MSYTSVIFTESRWTTSTLFSSALITLISKSFSLIYSLSSCDTLFFLQRQCPFLHPEHRVLSSFPNTLWYSPVILYLSTFSGKLPPLSREETLARVRTREAARLSRRVARSIDRSAPRDRRLSASRWLVHAHACTHRVRERSERARWMTDRTWIEPAGDRDCWYRQSVSS